MDWDLESYISNYSGRTKILRLQFIAANSPALAEEALVIAVTEVKKTRDTAKYLEIAQALHALNADKYPIDRAWVDSENRKAAQLQDRLESDAQAQKSSSLKDGTRLGFCELANFYYDRGNLEESVKKFMFMRDYITNSKDFLEMCFSVIKIYLELGRYSTVGSFVGKGEASPALNQVPLAATRLKAVSGLVSLEDRNYRQAARRFLEVSPELSNHYSEVISPRDIAMYGSLCALATYDRTALKKNVLDNVPFRQFLEAAPGVREAIVDFYESRYSSCLSALDSFKPQLLLDLHLHDHVNALYRQIRDKAIVQYFGPYSSIRMDKMADTFNTNIQQLEEELCRMIMEGQIQARIDSHNKILYARTADQRGSVFSRSLKMGDSLEEQTNDAILRLRMSYYDFHR